MNVYLFIGGAYSDLRWTSTTPPNTEEWDAWSRSQLEILKIDSDLRVYEPHASGMWALLPVALRNDAA